MKRKTGKTTSSVFSSALPLLAFSLVICLLVICFYEAGYTSLPPTEKRYMTAKAGISTLRQNEKKNMQREPWEQLAKEFQSIYENDPAWPNRPAALFRAAEALEELAKRSCARADVRKAINCYESLALKHSQSRLADDALYQAAKLRASLLKDDKGALTLLNRIKKQYPKGDMLTNAIALEKAIIASSNGKIAPDAIKAVANSALDKKEAIESPALAKKSNFAGDIPLRFKAAKSRIAKLLNDGTRSCWRQPWEELREEFLRIHKQAKNTIAPQALFHAAECQQNLAKCSRIAADKSKAIELFKQVAISYPKHELADDALLAAARNEYNPKNITAYKNAVNSLNKIIRQYPAGNSLNDAKKLLSIWQEPSSQNQAKNTSKKKVIPELQVLSWDSISKNNVEIVLELSAPAQYTTTMEKGAQGKPAHLYLDLKDADIVKDIRRGVNVNGSLLKAVKVSSLNNGSNRLQFDFREIKQYETVVKTNPDRIIVNVAAGKIKKLPAAKNKPALAKNTPTKSALKASLVQDMASQLGLTVKRVFIDAGHGGKDPGTSHNSVIEKNITLDIALSLGKLLEANGMEVFYSRTVNKAIPLSERTRMANAMKADLFVSIHVNANENSSANGIETYYLDLATNKQAARVAMLENAASDKRLGDMQSMLTEVMLHARANESKRLASDIQRLTVSRLNKRDYTPRNNGVKSAPFHVLLGAKMPAVLVEVGYCSNSTEANNLSTVKYRQAIAVGLAEGIAAYRDRLLRNRTADKTLTPRKAGAI